MSDNIHKEEHIEFPAGAFKGCIHCICSSSPRANCPCSAAQSGGLMHATGASTHTHKVSSANQGRQRPAYLVQKVIVIIVAQGGPLPQLPLLGTINAIASHLKLCNTPAELIILLTPA